MSEVFSSVLVLPADLERLAVLPTQTKALMSHAPAACERDSISYNITLAVHELCVNIIRHAYAGERGKFMLTLTLLDSPWRVVVSTCDHGRCRFDFAHWAPPNLDEIPVHGLGLFLMQRLMDQVVYVAGDDCSHWHMVKYLETVQSNSLCSAR